MAYKRGPEEIIHRDVAEYLRVVRPRALWWHTPNGARMSKAQAGIHKALGMLSGVPDLIFICEDGLAKFVELKAEGKYLSQTQKAFRETVAGLGCEYAVCRSVEDVSETLKEWGLIPAKALVRPVQGDRGGAA